MAKGLAEMRTDDATAQRIVMLMGGLARLNGALVAAGKRSEADEIAAMSTRLREIAHGEPVDPRPDDMAELARLTAVELRKRGIWAEASSSYGGSVLVYAKNKTYHSLQIAEFDNLGPIACADEIQRQETNRIREWAGDK